MWCVCISQMQPYTQVWPHPTSCYGYIPETNRESAQYKVYTCTCLLQLEGSAECWVTTYEQNASIQETGLQMHMQSNTYVQ